MRRTTLQGRLTFLFSIIIVFVVLLVGWFVANRARNTLIEQARRTGVALARSIAAVSSNDFFSYNYVALEQKAEEAARDPEVAYVVLYDKEGKVAAFTGQGLPGTSGTIPDLDVTADPEGVPGEPARITERLMPGYAGPGLDILLPVIMSGEELQWGSVRLGLRLDSIHRQISGIRWFTFSLGLAGVLIGWGSSVLFTRRITIPLSKLVGATVRVSEGDYDTTIRTTTRDEVQDLAENFNIMVGRLKEQRGALEENLREIRNLKHYSDLVILSITNGLITIDSEGRIVTFNRKAEEILHTASEMVLGQTPCQVWGRDNVLTVLLAEGIAREVPMDTREIRWPAENGTERILEVNTAILEDDSSPVGLLALIQDLTERRALEEKIRRSDRLAALGTLATGLAHEIKNPLTAVRAFVQMLPDKYDRGGFREKFNRIVPRELDRVNELLENLLDLVRTPKLKIAPLPVTRCIEQVVETLEPEARERGVTVEVIARDETLEIQADESYLNRALFNIVLNGIQAMPDGGTLTIETIAESGDNGSEVVNILISDTGTGIPQDLVKDIFNPFYTSKEKGTGLGLAVTNKIIEDQDGTISVESERGTGTTFQVTLPSAADR